MRWLPAILLLGSTVACEPPPDVEPLACRKAAPGEADLGAGDLAAGFIPLEDGEDIPVIFGPQGMHMIVVSIQVRDLEAAEVGTMGNHVQVAIREQGEVVGGTVIDMEPLTSAEVSEFLGLRAVFTVAEIQDVIGKVIEVEGIVRDGCGRELETARWLTLVE
ncbi:MAG: hypothetical protein JRI25_18375 [Deltaproteobacteria bacterium]|nr:hypothetical protein [Deltaproteobacteria bacterium]MBW2256544.1 hypothetical protein [Deltaproteobacteria bacterium]